jgi:hypothetical protein
MVIYVFSYKGYVNIYSPTDVQFNHINCVISLSYMFRTRNLGSSSGTHHLKSHTIYTNWYSCLKRWLDCTEEDLRECAVSRWKTRALDRVQWKSITKAVKAGKQLSYQWWCWWTRFISSVLGNWIFSVCVTPFIGHNNYRAIVPSQKASENFPFSACFHLRGHRTCLLPGQHGQFRVFNTPYQDWLSHSRCLFCLYCIASLVTVQLINKTATLR